MSFFLRLYIYLASSVSFALDLGEIATHTFAKYQRPFSVLYINPASEETILELSSYSSCFFLIIEANPLACEQYISICEKHHLSHIVILQVLPIDYVLALLKELEAFDIVIFDRKEPFPLMYSKNTLENLAQFVVVSHAGSYLFHKQSLEFYKQQANYNDFTLYEFDNSTKAFKYNNCLYPKKGYHTLYKDFEKQYLYKSKENLSVEWIPGINFVTFKLFIGVYPKMDSLYEKIKNLPWNMHSDPQIINIIVTGNDVCFIDHGTPARELTERAQYHHDMTLAIAHLEPWEFLNSYYLLSTGSTIGLHTHKLYKIVKQHYQQKKL